MHKVYMILNSEKQTNYTCDDPLPFVEFKKLNGKRSFRWLWSM